MYDVIVDERVFVYDLYDQIWYEEFENLNYCCAWLINKRFISSKALERRNKKELTNKIASNMNDLRVENEIMYINGKWQPTDIPFNNLLIMDANKRILSKSEISIYILENLNIIKAVQISYSTFSGGNKLSELERKWEKREKLLSDIKKLKYFKHPSVGFEKKFSSSEEHKEFIRPKRNTRNLPDSWDDKPMCKSISWKDNTKFKKSWMKNTK